MLFWSKNSSYAWITFIAYFQSNFIRFLLYLIQFLMNFYENLENNRVNIFPIIFFQCSKIFLNVFFPFYFFMPETFCPKHCTFISITMSSQPLPLNSSILFVIFNDFKSVLEISKFSHSWQFVCIFQQNVGISLPSVSTMFTFKCEQNCL